MGLALSLSRHTVAAGLSFMSLVMTGNNLKTKGLYGQAGETPVLPSKLAINLALKYHSKNESIVIIKV